MSIAFTFIAAFIFGYIVCGIRAEHREMTMCMECWSGRPLITLCVKRKEETFELPQPKWFLQYYPR